jgi:tRNA (adenine37-N6)-methyltransferase
MAKSGEVVFRPIGVIHSPFKTTEGMPIQPSGAQQVLGEVEVFPRYAKGLQDLEGFSHIILLYYFHRARRARLVVIPFLDSKPHGVFATRAPSRPNPVGLSVVRFVAREGNSLRVQGIDILDGTPLLDIKPYVPAFDVHDASRVGWLQGADADMVKAKRSDTRFR